MKDRTTSPLFTGIVLIVGLVSQAMGAILVKLCSDVPPLMIATFRMFFSSAILIAYALLYEKARASGRAFLWFVVGRPGGNTGSVQFQHRVWSGNASPFVCPCKKNFLLCVLSGVFLSFHFSFWIYSLQYTTVASSVVIVNMNAIFVGILSYLLFGEKQSIALVLGIIAAVVGCFILTVFDEDFKGFIIDQPGIFLGNMLALSGSFASSFYLLIGSRVRQHVNLVSYVIIVYSAATGLLVLACLLAGIHFFGYRPASYLCLLLMAVFPQLIGHSSFNWVLKTMKSSIVAVTKMGEPICSAIFAYLIFSETVNLPQLGGIIIIFCAIIFVLRKSG